MVTLLLTLRRENAATPLVSRFGSAKTIALPKREVSWAAVPGRVEVGPRGIKLAVIEATMPEWLAKERGLS